MNIYEDNKSKLLLADTLRKMGLLDEYELIYIALCLLKRQKLEDVKALRRIIVLGSNV